MKIERHMQTFETDEYNNCSIFKRFHAKKVQKRPENEVSFSKIFEKVYKFFPKKRNRKNSQKRPEYEVSFWKNFEFF